MQVYGFFERHPKSGKAGESLHSVGRQVQQRGKDQNVLPRVFMDPRGPFQLDACFPQTGIGEHGATATAQRPLNERVLMWEQARVKFPRLEARGLNAD